MKGKKEKIFKKYIKHLERFMTRMELLPSSGRLILSVSAGVDSMVLLHMIHSLQIRSKLFNSVRVVHFHHGTRPENDEEYQFLKQYCDALNISFTGEHLNLAQGGNFELRARDDRYAFMKKLLRPGDLIYTAHHMDDSFEWSLMQQFKNGTPESELGIPVINGTIARPFMCFSKKQIEAYATYFEVPFYHDASNDLSLFERNYVRNEIIPKIKQKFPSYLKHYVHRSTLKAFRLGLLRNSSSKNNNYLVREDDCGGIALISVNAKFDQEALPLAEKLIKRLSLKQKGSLKKELFKLMEAISNGKKGPMSFSGGVKIYLEKGWLYMINDQNLASTRKWDRALVEAYNQRLVGLPELPFLYAKSLVLNPKKNEGEVKRIHPLLPEFSALLRKKHISFTFKREKLI